MVAPFAISISNSFNAQYASMAWSLSLQMDINFSTTTLILATSIASLASSRAAFSLLFSLMTLTLLEVSQCPLKGELPFKDSFLIEGSLEIGAGLRSLLDCLLHLLLMARALALMAWTSLSNFHLRLWKLSILSLKMKKSWMSYKSKRKS